VTVDPRSLLNLIRTRRSERRMWPSPLPRADLETIVEAGLWAPSGSNQQPWHFVVVTRRDVIKDLAAAVGGRILEIRERIHAASGQRSFDGYTRYLTFFGEASAVIAVFTEPYRALLERLLARYAPELSADARENASALSAAAAVQNMLLMAHVYGYAACWLTGPLVAKTELEAKLKPAGDWGLISLIALGARYPDQSPAAAPPRRDPGETVTFIE